jgi:hypothetical protein
MEFNMNTSKKLLLAGLALCFLQSQAMNQDAAVAEATVSYIYYPSQVTLVGVGHAELEVKGCSWMLFSNSGSGKSSKPLSAMIDKSTRDGLPFLRFVFQVTPEDAAIVEKAIAETEGSRISCSVGALSPLTEAGVCSIPAPLTISPLLSAAYLMACKTAGINNIKKIEYYGNPSMTNSALKMLSGVANEAFLIGYIASVTGIVARHMRASL